jgi:hypothetical protein
MDGPNCRFQIGNAYVDVMPSDESILGFHNKWYPLIFEKPLSVTLSEELSILVIDPSLFLCTKIEAFRERGQSDYIMSHDIEDVITILYGRAEIFLEVSRAAAAARDFLHSEFEQILADNFFHEALPGMIPAGPAGEALVIEKRMQAIVGCAGNREWLARNQDLLSDRVVQGFKDWQDLK